MSALGLVETKGLVGAVEAADAMLKTADVSLLEKNLAGGGLVTITITGEVAAVQAAVEGAVAAVGRIAGALVVSAHVIPRPVEDLAHVIRLTPVPSPTSTPPASPAKPAAPATPVAVVKPAVPAATAVPAKPATPPAATAVPAKPAAPIAAPAKPAAPAKGKRRGIKK